MSSMWESPIPILSIQESRVINIRTLCHQYGDSECGCHQYGLSRKKVLRQLRDAADAQWNATASKSRIHTTIRVRIAVPLLVASTSL